MVKKLLLFLCVALIICARTAQAWPGTVLSIQDGDTMTIAVAGDTECPLTVRLYGIDAPENRQEGGPESTAYLSGLLPIGSTVEVVPMDKDRYGRSVALVAHSGRVINGRMVAGGHAWVYAKYCRASVCKKWYALQKKAAAEGIGLWSAGNSVVAPWVWRRMQKDMSGAGGNPGS